MSHIDEGEIQAYLDGAYDVLSTEQLAELERRLDQDEAFRARVEEARALRTRAQEILLESGPTNIVAPSFEELQRLAAIRPPGEENNERRWVRIPPVVGLGWAATVVLALGVGWFAGQGAGEPMRFNDALQAPATEAAPADDGSAAEGASTVEGFLDSDDGPAGGFRSPASTADKKEDLDGFENRRLESSPDQEPELLLDEVRSPERQQGSEEAPPAVAREGSAPSSVDAVTVTGESQDAQERSSAALELNEVVVGGQEEASDITLRQKAAATAQPAANEPPALELAESEQDEIERRRAARQDDVPADRAAGAGAYAEQNRDMLGRSTGEHVFHSLALPGLEVLGVSLEDAGALSGLKILHLLPTGDTLEILYVGLFSEAADPRGVGFDQRVETEAFPALSAQLQEAALPPGWRQVVVRKENRWVVARAPISEAEIRAYLMTLN